MRRDDCSDAVTGFVAFLAGTVVGVGLGILFAPRSGRETREKLVRYGEELQEKAGEVSDDLKERGCSLIGAGKEMIERGKKKVELGRQFLDEQKKVLATAIEAGRDAMKKEQEVLAATLQNEEE